MKPKLYLVSTVLLLTVCFARGQGTFIYDQESSTDELADGAAVIQPLSPYGQSFTPTLTAIRFIQLNLGDYNPNNSLGATVYLNLRVNSIDGSILAVTPGVTMGNGFAGTVNFLFSSDVALTAGATYTFEILVQSGDLWYSHAGELSYSGGMAFANGAPASASDIWFREGIVPEPSSAFLFLLGAGIVIWRRRSS